MVGKNLTFILKVYRVCLFTFDLTKNKENDRKQNSKYKRVYMKKA